MTRRLFGAEAEMLRNAISLNTTVGENVAPAIIADVIITSLRRQHGEENSEQRSETENNLLNRLCHESPRNVRRT
jgi:hypothetical protein